MSLITFTEFLKTKGLSTAGLTQSQFSTNYTAWLTSIFSDAAVQQWLRDTYKVDLAGQAIQVNLNQNSSTLLPTVNGITDQRIYDALFGEKSSLIVGTGKTSQERSYVSSFEDSALKAMFAPKVSGPVAGEANEDGIAAPLKALANVTDADTRLESLKVLSSNLPAGVTYDESTKSFVLDTSHEAYQHLAKGQTQKVSFTYIVSDGQYQTEATATWTITGTNDAPAVSGSVTGEAREDGVMSALNALANATDKDDDTVLTVVDVPAANKLPAGVTYDAATHTFGLDPSNDAYQHLAAGKTQVVTVNYGVSDGIITTEASVSWTVTGTNDAPDVKGAVTGTANEGDSASTLNALANASDKDDGTTLTVVNVPAADKLPAGVTYDAATKTFSLDPSHAAFQHLADGKTQIVTVDYEVSDGIATTKASVSWTVTGTNDAPRVSDAVKANVDEDGDVSQLDALAHASDPDDGSTLSVVNVPAPGDLPMGVAYDAATHTFTLDPSHAAFQYLADGQKKVVTVHYGVSDGVATTDASVSWTIVGTNDAPEVSGAVTGTATEDGAASTLSALANASDRDIGAVLSVVNVPAADKLPDGVAYNAATGTFSLDPTNGAYQHLAAGQKQVVTVQYGVSDGIATTAASVSWTITGTNDAPVVSGAVIGTANEDGSASALDALGNATDKDDGAVLSVVNVPTADKLPAGVTYDAATHTFSLDPSDAAFQHLAAGQKQVVTVDYGVSDGIATTNGSVSWTVTGTNDVPRVSDVVKGNATEDGAVSHLGALANASDTDEGAVLTIVDVPAADKLPAGVTYDAVTKTFNLDPANGAYQHLAAGQTQVVTVNYGVSDGIASTNASVSWTVTGSNDAPIVSGAVTGAATEDGSASILNALANASDKDDSAVLSVVNVPATADLPAGVTYDAEAKTFSLDPSDAAFQHLAAGKTQVVTVHYGVSDGIDTTDASVSWTITGTNDAPKSVSLDHSSVAENAAGAVIGKLSAVDPDDNDVVSFAVLKADGSGSVDNRFTVDASGNLTLAAGVALNYEAASSINVVIRATDKDGLSKDQAFTVAVQDVNEAPTAVQLLNKLASTPENGGAVKVADISVSDDALGSNALSLSGADSGSFEIRTIGTSKELWFKGGADFEKKAAYDVTVNVDDPTVGANPDAFATFHFGIADVVEGTRVSFDTGSDGASYVENGLKVRALTSGDTLDFVTGTGAGDQDLKLHSGKNSPYEFSKDGGGTFTLLGVDLVGSEGSGGTWYAYKNGQLVGSQDISGGSAINFSQYGDLFKDVTSVKWETVNDNQNANQSQTIDNLWFI